MKPILIILFPLLTLCATAQTHLPVSNVGYGFGSFGYGFLPWQSVWSLPSYQTGPTAPKWQLRSFANLSAGYIFLNNGISYVSAPVGLALFHPLSTKWTAYGAATVTPTMFNVNHLITDPNYQRYPYGSGYGLGLSTGIQGGLIYTNEAKTFSISGSVRLDRTTYPVYPTNKRYSTTTKGN
ncbi:MAG: hypothetical protein JST68_22080 [Bacteroidetes bacterium]|nr:hypothetical protein [Bacteroidota bacterium]